MASSRGGEVYDLGPGDEALSLEMEVKLFPHRGKSRRESNLILQIAKEGMTAA